MLYPTHRRGGYEGRLDSNVSQDGHCNHYVSRPNIVQTTVNQRAPRLPSNVLNNKPVRRNFSQHFPIGQDGLLGYSASTQPQLAGACLNCPPSQVQQVNPLYQNNDFLPSEIPGPTINTLFLAKPTFILIIETWCSQAVSDSQLNILNYRLYRCDRENKRGGCIMYVLDTITNNKVEDSVLNSLPESVWISVNTLNHSLLLECIYRAPDSSSSVDDLVINAFIHASALNFNAKAITGGFNYPGINWSTGSCQSSKDEFSATINMHCWSQWVRTPTR
ncbi:unnamed protein product, partial [Schistosoma mattheei]